MFGTSTDLSQTLILPANTGTLDTVVNTGTETTQETTFQMTFLCCFIIFSVHIVRFGDSREGRCFPASIMSGSVHPLWTLMGPVGPGYSTIGILWLGCSKDGCNGFVGCGITIVVLSAGSGWYVTPVRVWLGESICSDIDDEAEVAEALSALLWVVTSLDLVPPDAELSSCSLVVEDIDPYDGGEHHHACAGGPSFHFLPRHTQMEQREKVYMCQ